MDKFTFQGHKLLHHYNPDRHHILLKQRSVAAEVDNTVLDKSAGFIRYLKREKFKPYLRVLFDLHNFSTMLRDEFNRKELLILDLGSLYNESFNCSCVLFQLIIDAEIWTQSIVELEYSDY